MTSRRQEVVIMTKDSRLESELSKGDVPRAVRLSINNITVHAVFSSYTIRDGYAEYRMIVTSD